MFTDFVRSQLRADAVIVEAGAHDGRDSVGLALRWPNGMIYAFEPNPAWHKTLREKYAAVPQVSFSPIALGDKDGETDFYEYTANLSGAESTLPPVLQDDFWVRVVPREFASPIKVPMRTLDSWAEEHGVQRVDFLRLDM